MFKMELQWKEFRINLSSLDQQLRSSYPSYAGNQAHGNLELWFKEEPSQEEKDQIQAIWDGINSNHDLVKSYKSAEDIKIEKELKRQSALDKLAALGLSQEELKALMGQ